MAEIIEASSRFAPLQPDEFVSGEKVEPGVYVDVETGATLTLMVADVLPDTVRLIHCQRRFRRVNNADTEQNRMLQAMAA